MLAHASPRTWEVKAGGLLGVQQGHPGLQSLRALAALPENLGLLLGTDKVTHSL